MAEDGVRAAQRQGRPPLREVRSRIFDSARWAGYQPRAGDVVIASYPKCGTTWTQRIVGMLLAGGAAPFKIHGPWFDFRLGPPVEASLAEAFRSLAIEMRRHFQLTEDDLPKSPARRRAQSSSASGWPTATAAYGTSGTR